MLLAQLEVVVEVARLGSLSQAADALSLTQPAVSWRLRALESELGVRLFVRTRRGVRPTGAGMALLPHAQRAVQAAYEAARTARDHQDTRVGELVVATIAGIGLTVLPEAVRRLYRRHPDLRLTVHTAVSETIAEMVTRGVATLGVAADIQHPDLECVPLFDDRLALVTHVGRGNPPRATVIEAQPFVLVETAPRKQRQLQALLQEAGLRPHRFIYMDTVQAAKELVARGTGFAFLPTTHIAADLASGTLQQIDLPGSTLPARRIVALRKTSARPAPDPVKSLIGDLRDLGRAADDDVRPSRVSPNQAPR